MNQQAPNFPAPVPAPASADGGRVLLRSFAKTYVLFFVVAAYVLWRAWTPVAADRLLIGGPEGDFVRQVVPWRAVVAKTLAGGHAPLWNPHAYAGTPLLADPQAAVLYPWRLLQVPLAIAGRTIGPVVVVVEAIAHVALAGALTAGLIRALGAGGLAALVGAAAFAFGGYVTGYPLDQLAVLVTAAWIPGTLWALVAAVNARTTAHRRLVASAAGIATAMGVLGGHPQTAAFGVAAAIGWLAWRGVFAIGAGAGSRDGADARRVGGADSRRITEADLDRVAGADTHRDTGAEPGRVVGGDTREVTGADSRRAGRAASGRVAGSDSRRTAGVDLSQVAGSNSRRTAGTQVLGVALWWVAVAASLSAVQWLPAATFAMSSARELTLAEQLGGLPPGDALQWLAPHAVSRWSPLYIGILPLALALWALIRVPAARFWGGMSVMAWLWALGGNGPVVPAVVAMAAWLVPFRGQERAAVLVALGLAVAAGLAVDRLLSRDDSSLGEPEDPRRPIEPTGIASDPQVSAPLPTAPSEVITSRGQGTWPAPTKQSAAIASDAQGGTPGLEEPPADIASATPETWPGPTEQSPAIARDAHGGPPTQRDSLAAIASAAQGSTPGQSEPPADIARDPKSRTPQSSALDHGPPRESAPPLQPISHDSPGSGLREVATGLVVLAACLTVAATVAWVGGPGPAVDGPWSWADAAAHGALWAAVGALVLALGASGRLHGRRLASAVLVVTLLDLLSANTGHALGAWPPGGPYREDAVVVALKERAREGRVSSQGLLPGGANAASMHGLFDVTGDSPLHLRSTMRLVDGAPEIVWWRLLGVRWVVRDRPLEPAEAALLSPLASAGEPSAGVSSADGPTAEHALYEVQLPAPPAWTVQRTVCIEDIDTWLPAVDLTPLAAVVVERDVVSGWVVPPWDASDSPAGPRCDGESASGAQSSNDDVAPGEATLVALEPGRAVVEALLTSPGWVVWSSGGASHDGWRARVVGDGGREGRMPTVAAYGALPAVWLPAGEWRVEWTYRPLAVILGAATSALAVVVLVALAHRAGRVPWRRRRPVLER